MIQSLLNTTENIALINKLISHAEANKVNHECIKLMISGELPPVGDDENFVIKIENYRIVYSLEWNPQGWVKHLSITENNQMPDDEAAQDIAEIFGYDFDSDIFAYEEKYVNKNNEKVTVFNVLQLVADEK